MRKYLININNGTNNTEVSIINDKELFYNNQSYEYDVKHLSENLVVLRINGSNYIAKVEKDLDADTDLKDTAFKIDINSESYNVACKSELDTLTEKFSRGRGDSKFKNDVLSPMPGAIVKINVKEEQLVKKGDVLLVLEAMKMENELKAVKPSIVKKILVEEKMSVDKGQLLMKLDNPESV
jgi:biotin carboxyl carrier protein